MHDSKAIHVEHKADHKGFDANATLDDRLLATGMLTHRAAGAARAERKDVDLPHPLTPTTRRGSRRSSDIIRETKLLEEGESMGEGGKAGCP